MSMDLGSKSVKSDINVTPRRRRAGAAHHLHGHHADAAARKPVQLPDAKHVSALKGGGDPVLLSITADGKAWIDKVEVPIDQLSSLTVAMQMAPGSPVMIDGDKALDYKKVREIILEVSKTHLLGVSLAASEMKEKQ